MLVSFCPWLKGGLLFDLELLLGVWVCFELISIYLHTLFWSVSTLVETVYHSDMKGLRFRCVARRPDLGNFFRALKVAGGYLD